MGYYVYKYVWKNKVIYVGKSNVSLKSRIKAHKQEQRFKKYLGNSEIFSFECCNPAETNIYETFLINKYKPILNRAMKYNDVLKIDIEEPEWERYDEEENVKKVNRNIENQIDKSSLTNLSFKTNSKQVSELNSYCKRNNEKISEVIRKALDIYIDNFAMKLKKKKQ